MEKLVIFHYDDGSRSGQTIRKLLKDFKGYLQRDGYSAYNVFEGTEEVCLITCLAHIRRHFEMDLEENRSLAEHALKIIQEIYRTEHFADSRDIHRKNGVNCGSVSPPPCWIPLKSGWEAHISRLRPKAGWDRLSPMRIRYGPE